MLIKMSKSQVEKYFTEVSADYFHSREQEYAFKVLKDIVLDMIEERYSENGKFVDIGCGAGLLTGDLLDLGFEVWGIDLSKEMIINAKAILKEKGLNQENVHYSVGEIEHLEFPDNFFSVISCIGVFEYLGNYRKALEEIRRILIPGGVAIIALPTKISLYYIPFRFIEKMILPFCRNVKKLFTNKKYNVDPVKNLCTPWGFDSEIESIGFKKIESRFSSFLIYPLYPIFPRLSTFIDMKMNVFSKSAILGWMGTNYIIKIVKI